MKKKWIRIITHDSNGAIMSIIELEKKFKKDGTLGNGFTRFLSKEIEVATMFNGYVEIRNLEV